MSDIYFKCACGKSLAVDERGAGHTVNCADCMALIDVPMPEMEFPCKHCGDYMLAPKSMANKDVQCALCGGTMKIPLPHMLSLWGPRRETPSKQAPSFPVRTLFKAAAALLLIGASLKLVPWENWIRDTETDPLQSMSALPVRQTMPIETEPVFPEPSETFEFSSDIEPAEAVHSDEKIHEIAAVPEVTEQPVNVPPEVPEETAPEEKVAQTLPDSPETELTVTGNAGLQPGIAILPDSQKTEFAATASAGPAPNGSPAEYLRLEARSIKEMRRKHQSPGKNPAVTGKIRELREEFLRYTLTHTGNDLDVTWSNAGQNILCLSSHAEWNSFADANRAMKEAFDIVASSEPARPVLKTKVIFHSAMMHLQAWHKSEPEQCAHWLDKASELAQGDEDMEQSFQFFSPTFETELMFSADSIPPEQREAFINKRQDNLMETLVDETISLDARTRTLWWWAAHLNGSGQAGKAAGLLDNWYETYGEQIKSPLFFEIRMLIAAHAEGDWEKVREMVGRLRTLVEKGVVSKDDESWNNVTEKYYRYIHLPPHEIKRQYHAMYGKGQNRI